MPAVTITDLEAASEPSCLDAATRDVLIKLIGVAIDRLGVDTARAIVPALVGYLAGAPYGGARWRPGRGPAPSPPALRSPALR